MLYGHVKFYNSIRGFGIIVGDDETDYFVHVSTMGNAQNLYQGERVSFVPVFGAKGMQAREIVRLDPSSMVLHVGRVVHLCENKGYGFIHVEGRTYDLFFHLNDVSNPYNQNLTPGQPIVCQVREDRDGRDRAYAVQLVPEVSHV